jgi:transposase
MLRKGDCAMAKRKFNIEFKQSAVKLVQDQGYTVLEAAKSLGVDPGSIRGWIKKFSAVSGGGAGDRGMRAELQRLRAENKQLLMEREILKKATVFFAKHES